MAMRPSQLPNLHRLLRGASTLNARTDASCTVTLPNHVGMVTGRGLEGTDGHGWSANEYAPDQPVLHEVAGRYIPSIFDVAHDRGVYTAVYATKTKFALFESSWGSEHERTGSHPA